MACLLLYLAPVHCKLLEGGDCVLFANSQLWTEPDAWSLLIKVCWVSGGDFQVVLSSAFLGESCQDRSKTLANCLLILFIWMFQRPLIYRPCKHQTKVMLLSSANPGFLGCFLSYPHLFRHISQYLRSHSSPTSIPSPLWHPVISHPPRSPSWMSLRFTHFLQIHPPCLKRQASLSCSSHKPGNFHYSFLSLITPYHQLADRSHYMFTRQAPTKSIHN